MAVTTTEILGTDSIAGSRIVINDNFAVLRDEINAIEAYIDPDAGTIDGLNSLETLELRVGPAGNYNLELTGTAFIISTDLEINASLFLNGTVSNASFAVLDEAAFSGIATLDPTTGFAAYSIKHATTSDFTIELGTANPGQEIEFYVEQKGGGSIIIQAATGAVFVIDSTNDKVSLDDVGSSVILKYVLDSSNNGSFFVKSGHAYTATV